jgi:hypothetical protein
MISPRNAQPELINAVATTAWFALPLGALIAVIAVAVALRGEVSAISVGVTSAEFRHAVILSGLPSLLSRD